MKMSKYRKIDKNEKMEVTQILAFKNGKMSVIVINLKI